MIGTEIVWVFIIFETKIPTRLSSNSSSGGSTLILPSTKVVVRVKRGWKS